MDVERFIEAVRNEEALWNLSHPHYKNVKTKMAIWKRISKKFHIRVDDCKRKWKSLRDGFNRSRSRRKFGYQSNDEMEPEWKYAQSLEFLIEHSRPRDHRFKAKYYGEEDSITQESVSTTILDTTTTFSKQLPNGSSNPDYLINDNEVYIATEFTMEKLIEAVRNEAALWDLKNPDYKNVKKKLKIWKKISKEMKISVEDCKRKWKTLRDGFNRYKAKLTDQSDGEKEAEWKYAQSLEFLFGQSRPRTTIGMYVDDEYSTTDESSISQTCLDEKPISFEQIDSCQEPGDFSTTPGTSKRSLSPPPIKTKSPELETSLPDVMKCLLKLLNKNENTAEEELMDEDVLFCKSMMVKMKKFPLAEKSRAKLFILSYLNKIELELHSKKQITVT